MKKLILSVSLLISGSVVQAMAPTTSETVTEQVPVVREEVKIEVTAPAQSTEKITDVQTAAAAGDVIKSFFVGLPASLKTAASTSVNAVKAKAVAAQTWVAAHPKTTAAVSGVTSVAFLTTAWKLRKKNPVVATFCALASAASASYAGYVVYKNGLVKAAWNSVFPAKAQASTPVATAATESIVHIPAHTVEGTYGTITIPAADIPLSTVVAPAV